MNFIHPYWNSDGKWSQQLNLAYGINPSLYHWATDIPVEVLCGLQRLALREWMDQDEITEICFNQEMNKTCALLKIYPL